jgi:phosphatidylethanolamine-binding protein
MRFLRLTSLVTAAAAIQDHTSQQPLTSFANHASQIRATLRDNAVIGDVLDDFTPAFRLELTYPKHNDSILLGNDIPVAHAQERPNFTIHSLDPSALNDNATFTLALTDPDAKSRSNPKWSEMCHWLVTNLTTAIPGPDPPLPLNPMEHPSRHADKLVNELKGYKPPGPPPKTGAHRYVFVLLQGEHTDLTAPKDRQHWGYEGPRHGVRDWAEENGLEVVGANFFFAENVKQ